MSKDLNQCNFIGRLGSEPDVKFTASGSAIANLNIACGDDYKDKTTGQKVEQTNWIRVVAFGRLAEIMKDYLQKGSKVFVSGKQVTRKWQDQSGADRYTTEIVANDMQMLDSQATNQGQAATQTPQQGYAPSVSQAPRQAPPQQPSPQQHSPQNHAQQQQQNYQSQQQPAYSQPQQQTQGQQHGPSQDFDDDIPF